MAWFRKKDGTTSTPVNYIRAADTVSRPMAVGLIISVFLVGAALAFTLFMGGRWVYNQFAKNDDTEIVQVEDTGQSTQKTSDETQNGLSVSDANGQAQPSAGQSSGSGITVTSSTTSTATSTPNTGPESIPNTGPMPE